MSTTNFTISWFV